MGEIGGKWEFFGCLMVKWETLGQKTLKVHFCWGISRKVRSIPISPRLATGENGGKWVGWLVGWLLPLCPSARPGPPRLQAMGGRGCVTRCTSHEPRAPGLARAALARFRSVRHVRVHRVARGALPARTLFRRSHLLALPPSPSVVCPRCAPLFRAGARRLRRPGAFRPGGGVGAEARPRRWP